MSHLIKHYKKEADNTEQDSGIREIDVANKVKQRPSTEERNGKPRDE